MSHIGCKHLNYDESKYPTCEIVIIEPEGWKYWKRVSTYEGCPTQVQFCDKSRVRINGVFQCINPGEMHCFEAQDNEPVNSKVGAT